MKRLTYLSALLAALTLFGGCATSPGHGDHAKEWMHSHRGDAQYGS